jgi:uncharacterized membrane protein YphA (DoxX/SURF4 family)
MDALFLIGRICFCFIFFVSGFAHVTDKGQMAGYVESHGLKPGRLLVLASGIAILVGAFFVVLGIWMDLGAILLGLFTLATAVFIHNYWTEKDPMARYTERVQFNKDLALTGAAAILLYAVWQLEGLAGLTITDPLFGV